VLIDTVAGTRALVQGGRLRALAVTSAKATELLPGVPSVMEQGVADFEVTAWNVLSVPRGVPAPIKERLHATMQQILRDPGYRARLLQAGFEPSPADPARPAIDVVRAERQRWGSLIRAKAIKP
jgi:tripartite-type tricarboxylate transporter receptor subunit TctC